MRIDTLFLDAFGPFTDKKMDLSGGKEGLHIIYGPNEAGKSAALRAITQLFYGIPARSPDNFIHQNYNTMCIGASISDGSDKLDFVRRKGIKGTLRNRNTDNVLNDACLDEFLGGIDENTFTMLFGLHHEALVNGGREIVEGHGDVGETLFAASAGLSNLREIMMSLNDEAGDLFKSSASKPSINAAMKRLADVRKNIKAALLRPNDWRDKNKELHEAIEKRDTIECDSTMAKTERNRIVRIVEASPVVAQYNEMKVKLDSVIDAELLPEDFGENFRALLTEKNRIIGDEKKARDEEEGINESIGNLSVNTLILEQESEIESLNELYAANKKALKDSDRLKIELANLETQAEKKLELLRPGLKIDDIPLLRIKPALSNQIAELGRQSEAVLTQLGNDKNLLEKLKSEYLRLSEKHKTFEIISLPDNLERTVKRIRKTGDVEKDLYDKEKKLSLIEKEISAGISRLGLWNGTMDELEVLAVPSPETIDVMKADFERLTKRRETIQEQRAATEDELKDKAEHISALRLEHEVPTEIILDNIRDLRNTSWRLVRRNWEQGEYPGKIEDENIRNSFIDLDIEADNLADTFESVTVKADDMADRLRSEADRVAELAQLESGKTKLLEKLTEFDSELSGIASEFDALKSSWSTLWDPLGITPRSPREMEAWTQRQREIMKTIGSYRETTAEVERITADIERNKEELSSALVPLDEDGKREYESLSALLDRAEDTIDVLKKKIAEKEKIEDKLGLLDTVEIPEAKRAVAQSEKKLDTWKKNWLEAMDGLGEKKDRSPVEATTIIQQIKDITELYDRVEELKKRIDQIVKDDKYFRQKVKGLTSVVNVDIDKMSEEQICLKLYNELKKSRTDKSRLDALNQRLEIVQKNLREKKAELVRIDDTLDGFCRDAHVSGTDELPSAWERSCNRRKYEEEIERLEMRLTELSSGLPLEEFIDSVMEEDIDALEARRMSIDETITEYGKEKDHISEKIGSLNKELTQMDGNAKAALLEEEAQSLLAEMSDDAINFARLKISEILLSRAIEQYRTKNQGPLLNRAGEIFSKLTLGSFQGLNTDFGDKGESILVGIRSNGRDRVKVFEMSEGSADQLYLALRLASLEQYISVHRPIPFILDDILVNFDDDRAAATLEILAGLSSQTQIIFFTHHKHIVEIANNTLDKKTLFTCDM